MKHVGERLMEGPVGSVKIKEHLKDSGTSSTESVPIRALT